MNVLHDVLATINAGVAFLPVVAHLGHSLGIPEWPGSTERLTAVRMHGFMLRRASIGVGIDNGLRIELPPQ